MKNIFYHLIKKLFKFNFFSVVLFLILINTFILFILSKHLNAATLEIIETYPLDLISEGIKQELKSEIMFEHTRFDDNNAFLDDQLPNNAIEILPISFDDKNYFSGLKSIGLTKNEKEIAYFVIPNSNYKIDTSENIVFYIKVLQGQVPNSLVVAFYDENGSCEHRAIFGENSFDFGGIVGTFSAYNAGNLNDIQPNLWYRVTIPAEALELGGHKIHGILFAKTSGQVFIDKITKSNKIVDPQKNRFQKVENILRIYKSSFNRLILKLNPIPLNNSKAQIKVKHSNGKTYIKNLVIDDNDIIFDLIDDENVVIPTGNAIFEVTYTSNLNKTENAELEYDILQLVANIQMPLKHCIASATIPIFGDALGMDFSHYTLKAVSLNPNESHEVLICHSNEPKFLFNRRLRFSGKSTVTGNLGSFNAGTNFGYQYERKKDKSLLNGLYRLVLTVYDTNQNQRVETKDIIIGSVISNTNEQFVESPDKKVAIYVPKYSITEGFTLASILDASLFLKPESKVWQNEYFERLTAIYEVRPRGLKFDKPATLYFEIDNKDKINLNEISIFKYQKNTGWIPLETKINENNELYTQIDGFNENSKTYFAVFKGNIKSAKSKLKLDDKKFDNVQANNIKFEPLIEVTSPTHPFLVQCDFEDEYSCLKPRSIHNNVKLSLDFKNKSAGKSSLKITNLTYPSDMGVLIYDKPFNVSKYPILSFDYKCPQTVEINIMLKTSQNKWYEIPLSNPTIGSAIGHICLHKQEFIRDDEWHTFKINLYEVLKNVSAFDNDDNAVIDEIYFCDYDYEGWGEVSDGKNPIGASYNIDNLIISSSGSSQKNVKFTWKINDPKIKKVSYTFDVNPYKILNEEPKVATSAEFNANIEGKDIYYFYIAGYDENNQLIKSQSQYKIVVDNTPPKVISTSPNDNESSASSIITAVIDDGDGSGVLVSSIKCEIDGILFQAGDNALTYDSKTKTMKVEPFKKIPPPPGFIQGQEVNVKIYGIKDYAQNEMKDGYSFKFKADFSSFTSGRDILLTTSSGFMPTFTPDSKTIIYCAPQNNKMQLFSINLDDKKPKLISKDKDSNYIYPIVLNDFKILACKKKENQNINFVLMDIDGNNEKQIFTIDSSDIFGITKSFDKKIVYFSADNEIYSYDIENNNLKKVLSDPNAFMLEPSLSPNGKLLAFRKDLYTNTIWLVNLNDFSQTQLTADGNEFLPHFIDNETLIFIKKENEIYSVYSIKTDGANLTKLIDGNIYKIGKVAVSPNGQYIAYETTKNGIWNISLFSLIYTPNVTIETTTSKNNQTDINDIKLSYEVTENNTEVTVKVYSHDGKLIKTLSDNKLQTIGLKTINWDLKDENNNLVDKEKPYIVKFEFKSKNSDQSVSLVEKVTLSEKAKEVKTSFLKIRKEIEKENKRKEQERLSKLEKTINQIKKGGDLEPPAAVSGFKAVAYPKKIELSWVKNTETDLLGYVITKHLKGENKLDEFKIDKKDNIFIDTKVEGGKTYIYSIYAIDVFGNKSIVREVSCLALFEHLSFALVYKDVLSLIKLNINEFIISVIDVIKSNKLMFTSVLLPPDNLAESYFISRYDDSYHIFSLNIESGELYYSRSNNLKAFSSWELITTDFYLPPDLSNSNRVAIMFTILPKNLNLINAICIDLEHDVIYEGNIKKKTSKIVWKKLYENFILPPVENNEPVLYSLMVKDNKYYIYATTQTTNKIFVTTTTNFKSFSAWKLENK